MEIPPLVQQRGTYVFELCGRQEKMKMNMKMKMKMKMRPEMRLLRTANIGAANRIKKPSSGERRDVTVDSGF